MKKLKLLILGILSIIGLSSYSFADYTTGGITYVEGIYHSTGQQLITIVGSSSIISIKDRNIGATSVYDGTYDSVGDTVYFSSYGTNISSCDQQGNFYQFGNNYGFSCSGIVSNGVSSIPTFGVLSSSVYTTPFDSGAFMYLSDVTNGYSKFSFRDIWGGITNTYESKQNMCPDGYFIPTESDFVGMLNMFNYQSYSIFNVAYLLKLPYGGYNTFPVGVSLSSMNNFQYVGGKIFTQNNHAYYIFDYTYRVSSDPFIGVRPVRCFKSSPVLPDSSRELLTGGSLEGLPDPEPEIPGGGNGGAGGGGGGWGDEIGIAQEPFDPTSYIIRMYASCYGYSGNLPEGFGYSGYYTDCSINYTGFANTFGGHIQSDDGYSIVVYDSGYDILNFMCSHTSYFNYSFCEDLDKYQGSQVGYNISTFPPKMSVVASGFAWVSQIGSGGYLYDPNCYGSWCSEVSLGSSSLIGNTGSVDTGSTESGSVGFPSRFDIPDLSIGEIFSLDYFKNFISSNLLFACPFLLNTGNINITLPEKFESYLGNYNPLNPIKCFTKAFKVGKEFTLYKSGVLSFDFGSGEYLFNSDSDLAKTFYSFFDIILSIGIVLFFLKIFKLLK